MICKELKFGGMQLKGCYKCCKALNINKSMPRRLKNEYLDKLGKLVEKAEKNPLVKVKVYAIATEEKKRPLLLGKELDATVQEYLEILKTTGTVVNFFL